MSIDNIGLSGGLPQGLTALLAQFSPTQFTASVASDNDGDFDSSSPSVPKSGTGASSNVLTGGGKAAINDQVLVLLTKLQQGPDSEAGAVSALNRVPTASPNAAQISTAIQAFGTANNAVADANSETLSILTLLNGFGRPAAQPGSTANVIV